MLQIPMPASPAEMPRAFFPLRRTEIEAQLHRGDRRFGELADARPVSVEARRIVVASDREQRFVYRLRSGWCARLRYLKDGRTQVTAILLPGDLISVRSMFLEQQLDEVLTLTDCEFDRIDQAALRNAAINDAPLMFRLWWQTLEDKRRLHNMVIALGRGSAEERVALLLLDIRGRLALAGVIAEDATEMPWPITQQTLAEILGLTSVHVNRVLKSLRERGLASIRTRIAHIDVAGLYALAHPLMDVFERQRPEYGAMISTVDA